MMVALPSVPLSLMVRATGPAPVEQASVWVPALAVLPARTVERLPSVRVAAWAPALMALLPSVLMMLPSVARATGPVARVRVWVPAQVLSAARTVELPPSALLASWARTPAVLPPTVPGLCPRRRFSPLGRRLVEQPIRPSR
jgi:hypothetical protein